MRSLKIRHRPGQPCCGDVAQPSPSAGRVWVTGTWTSSHSWSCELLLRNGGPLRTLPPFLVVKCSDDCRRCPPQDCAFCPISGRSRAGLIPTKLRIFQLADKSLRILQRAAPFGRACKIRTDLLSDCQKRNLVGVDGFSVGPVEARSPLEIYALFPNDCRTCAENSGTDLPS